jgi:GTP-binding protein EngB required for normal cell division
VQDSFERAKQWVEKLRKEVMGRHNKQGLVVAVVANKVDKVDERNRLMRVRSHDYRHTLSLFSFIFIIIVIILFFYYYYYY